MHTARKIGARTEDVQVQTARALPVPSASTVLGRKRVALPTEPREALGLIQLGPASSEKRDRSR